MKLTYVTKNSACDIDKVLIFEYLYTYSEEKERKKKRKKNLKKKNHMRNSLHEIYEVETLGKSIII